MKNSGTISVVAGVVALASSALLMGAGEGDPPQLTPIEEVIMYGIDADTFELLRYSFSTDEYARFGVVKDQDGNVVTDVEGLALIPHGPHKGLYGSANFFLEKPSRLVGISGLDATATVCPAEIGWDKVEGLVAVQDPDTHEWLLLGVARDPDPSLLRIDPATGAGTLVMETDERYQGLALQGERLFATSRDPALLYEIDLESGEESLVGDLGEYRKVEALEYAFGDEESRIKIPLEAQDVVPDSWTMAGVLFGFADDEDALLIINAETGQSVPWACSFQTIDCEGLVFTTKTLDPFGPIVAGAGD
ncbi:MAG: hypothetical protein ACYSW1_09420 [Planctomycetota bacterium]|jgi:hypothetical protein